MAEPTISALNAGTVKIGAFTVNRLGFGAMRITGHGAWGAPDDEQAAKEVLERAVELDINFIDTADAYGPEVSERLIHDALHPLDGILIATKGGYTRTGPGEWHPAGSPEHLREACESSLRRLEVDHIGLYQLHTPDPKVPFADSIQVLIDLKNEGKIRNIGLSNVSLDQLKQALEMTPIASVQNHYNFEHRRDSEALLQFCEQQGIAFIPYFPVGGGHSDYRQSVIADIAEQHQATPQQIALAWLLAHSPVMLPIPGTSSIEHLEENVAATTITLSDSDLTAIEALTDQ